MLLRSSSTPVLGSLLSPIQDGNNSSHESNTTALKHRLPPPSPTTTTIHRSNSYNKLSCVAFHVPSISCGSSPAMSPCLAPDQKGIRRAQSEGNLQGLAFDAFKSEEDLCNAYQPCSNKKGLGRNKGLMLESIPSFSYTSLGGRRGEDDSDSEDDEDREEYLDEHDEEEFSQRDIRGEGERVVAMGGGEFSLKNEMATTTLIEQGKSMETLWNAGYDRESRMVGQEMFLAKGLGIGGWGGGRGGGGNFSSPRSGGDGGNSQKVEEYYKKMVQENPGNPLFSSNYAQFLYKTKQDLPKAEEYYSRAILADPRDGEILSQYAKLVWELHNDEDRAAAYHEKAVLASPEDSHVHASYASFLWETEEDDDGGDLHSITPQIHQHMTVASAKA